MSSRHSSTSSGFSLLEMLLYIAILSIVIMVFSAAFLSFTNTRARAEAEREVNRTLRYVGERVTRDIQESTRLIAPANTGTTSVLSLSGANDIVYTLLDGRIMRQVGTSTGEATSDERVRVTELSFTRFENYNEVLQATSTSVTWHMIAEYAHVAPEYGYVGNKQGTVLLRN